MVILYHIYDNVMLRLETKERQCAKQVFVLLSDSLMLKLSFISFTSGACLITGLWSL